jgi:ATP-dependent exoDNAse (exonuclease V) beta subunit
VSALVSRIVADRHLMTLALTESRARESWRRIRFVMDQARLFDEVNGGDLRAFLRWVGHQRDEGANVTEAILPESDDDAVRITTIHSAKGLEYPVVFLLGLQAVPRSRKNPLLFTSHGAELHLTGGFETAGYDAAYEDEQVMDAYEQRRLLYVAATRARDILVVSAHRGENASASLAAQVIEQCESCTELWSDGSELCTTTSGAAVGIPAQIPDPPTDDEGSRMKFADRRARLLARESFPTTIAATGVRTLAQQRTSPAPVDVAGMAEVAPLEYSGDTSVHRRGRAGTAVGRAVHGVLQVIDLASGDDLESLAHAQAVAEGIADRTSEVRDCVRAALESDLVRQAVQDGRYWRELYVGVPVGDRVLEGFIDLLFETPEGLAIVDYKTDHIDAEDGAATVADRYRLQGAAYALGTRLALDRLVVSCTFLILSPNRAIAAPLIDLESAISEVEGLLTQPVH